MKRLLHIQASPRGSRSRSGAIGLHFLERLQARLEDLDIATLNVFDADLPAFDRTAIEGRYGLLVGKPVLLEQCEAWAELRTIADHFLSFDTWLFTVPMWILACPIG